MDFRYINKEKIKKISKCKLFISTYLLCGVLSLSGCGVLNNSIDNNTNSTSIESELNQNDEKYSVQLVFNNLDNLNADERDMIVIYDQDGNMYDAFYIYNIEEKHEFVVPVQDFIVNSEMLGKINVHIEEKEGSVIYVDYLNKTLDVETNVKQSNKVR